MRWWAALLAAGALAACATPHAPVVTPPASVAPAPAAAVPSGVSLTNPGFESTVPGRRNNDPEGWYSHQHAGEVSYKFALDTMGPHGGARSLRIDNVGREPYGAIAQSVNAAPYRGKTARLSGWLRTRDSANAALTLVVLANGVPLANNFMADAPVKGTTAWTRYTIALPVAPNAEFIEVGAMMQGKGTLWLDDVELEIGGK
ncbi:MAG: hypothetical protein ABW276_10055 [Casimicrobiaceae bacterium]|jgi:hypothetical protein